MQLSLDELQKDVKKNLNFIVYDTSLKMVLSGAYSTNPLKNLKYIYAKYKKGRGNK